MRILLETILIFPADYSVMLEIALIGLGIALIGAAGFVIFTYSMRDDRADRIRDMMVEDNPWSTVSGQNAVEAPQSKDRRISKAGLIRLIVVFAVLIFILAAVKYGWFGIFGD